MLLLSALLAGCAHEQAYVAGPAPSCGPTLVPGTRIASRETDRGVSIDFTADEGFTRDSGRVYELRQQVRRMAGMHNARMGSRGYYRTPGEYEGMREDVLTEIPSTANVRDIPGGVQLELVPFRPQDTPELQVHAVRSVARMQADRCLMGYAPLPPRG